MNKPVIALLSVLVVLVATHGFLVWRVGERAQADARQQSCIQRIEATAMIAVLTPTSRVDPEGRLRAITTLSTHLDDC